jgi:hypothetical protein
VKVEEVKVRSARCEKVGEDLMKGQLSAGVTGLKTKAHSKCDVSLELGLWSA